MSEQRVITCAVDLSWHSQAAFRHAVALAKLGGARLNLVFAVSARRPVNWRVRERVALLAELRRQASTADIDMTVSVQHGNPADVILAHANSPNTAPDLIVLGAPDPRGIERLRWSSVAQAVVHQADRPTLVVPGSSSTDIDIAVPFRRVLCAVDFSPASMSALDEALRILRNDGGTMRLLHVIDIAQPAVPRAALEFDPIEFTRELSKHAWRQLRTLLPLSEELHGRVHPHVSVGFVVDEIVRSAKEFKADLVVLGVTRRGWFGRILSSTTGRALRRLDCPVLAVPPSRRRTGASLTGGEAMQLAA
jgi:nucleotide-binding universal stress UspA family protein